MVSRITQSRRRFVEVLGQSSRITFSDLRSALVKSGEINLATLYRIVEAFREDGIIHEMEIAGERVIFPCQCDHATSEDAIHISFCENCGAIYDTHVKLENQYLSSLTTSRLKNCKNCVISE